jgi:hypothetical protein
MSNESNKFPKTSLIYPEMGVRSGGGSAWYTLVV